METTRYGRVRSSGPVLPFTLGFQRPQSPTRSLTSVPKRHAPRSSGVLPKPSASPSRTSSPSPNPVQPARRTCMCSPTNHPGSFRCSQHRAGGPGSSSGGASAHSSSTALNMRRSAMVNSIVRIGSVEGSEMIRKALTTLIRPSSHHMRRRAAFNPRPSRLCHMTRSSSVCS